MIPCKIVFVGMKSILFRETGSFTEIMLISSDKDLDAFRRRYGITGDIEVFY